METSALRTLTADKAGWVNKIFRHSFRVTILVFLLSSYAANAQTTYSWRNDQNPTSGQWNVANFWWNGSSPALPGGSEILFLDGTVGLTMTNDLPSTNRYRITFGSGGSSRTINGSSSNTFFDFSNNIPAVFNSSGNLQTINFPILIGNTSTITSPNYGFEVNASSGNLTFGSSATIGAANATGTKVLVLRSSSPSTGTITLNGVVSNSTGTISVSKIEGNVAIMGALNTYTGATTVTGGTLRAGVAQSGAAGPFGNNSDVKIGLSGTLDLNGNNATVYAVHENGSGDGGVVTLGSGVLTISGGWAGTYYQNSISGTSGSIVKQGSGILSLYGTQSFTGSTTVSGGELSTSVAMSSTSYTINGGTFRIANPNLIPDAANMTISSGTFAVDNSETINNLTISGGTLTVAAGKTLTINGTLTISGGTITNSGTIAYGSSGKLVYATGGSYSATALEWPASSGPKDVTVQTAGTNVSLPGARTITGTLTLSAGTLSIGSNILTLNGPLSYGTGTLTGSSSSSLVIGGTGLAQVLNFTAGSRILKDLTLSANATASLGTALDITAGATPGTLIVNSGATLTTGGNLTLKSDANGTARVGTSAGTISGTAIVERYINADVVGRKWHLLSGQSVTGASLTIRQSWQENGSGASNLGTWITSPGGGNGFDGSSNSSSILRYNQATPAWAGVSATNSGSINDEQGYMLFVRGDRTDLPSNATTHATVLRTTGALKQGTQASITVLATGGYTLVGNPFASPIDFESFFGTTNLQQSFYIWDPAYAGNYGVGGYRLVTRSGGGTYSATPTTGSDATLRYIHSGQAFFLKGLAGTALVVLDENSKTASTPVTNPFVNPIGDQQIYVEMRTVNNTGTVLNDAVRVFFNPANSAGIADDVEKISNFGENLSVYNQSKTFIVENRPLVGKSDTVFLRIGNMAIKNYRFQLKAIDFVQKNVTAWLEDAFTGKSTPISLNSDVTNIDFSITSDPASAKPDRFRIVFRTPAKWESSIVSAVSDEKDKGALTVFPNPVMNRVFSLKLVNMEKGLYQARILGLDGQAVFTRRFEHSGGDGLQNFRLENIPSGNYRLEITKPDGSRMMQGLAVDPRY